MTSLTRWRPIDELDRLWPRDLFSRLLPEGGIAVDWKPRCDVTEDEKEIVVHAELPGVAPEDIAVEVSDSTLVIRGEKKVERDEEKDGRTYSERFFGSFQRSIPIPNVDPDKIVATTKAGVLEVRLPKVEPEEQGARKINVTAS